MIVEFIRPKMYPSRQLRCQMLLQNFADLHGIKLNKMVIDFRKTRNEYVTDGLFGGFIDMYDKKTKTMYFNPHNFIEFQKDHISYKNLAHLAMHEMIHVKQVQTGEMKILNPNKLKFRGRIYDRAPFNLDLFNRIRDMDGALGEEYHWRALPWEKEAYQLPESFMNQPLWKTYAEY